MPRPGAWCDVVAARPERRRGSGPRGEKDPFPILGTLCAKRGLVRISRKDNKSIILHLERRTQRLESRRPQLGGSQFPDNPFMQPLSLNSSQSACSREKAKQSGDRKMPTRTLWSWPTKTPFSKGRWTTSRKP